jgi:hypothetical protein
MVLPSWLHRWPMVLFVFLLIAPGALFWHVFFPASQSAEEESRKGDIVDKCS